MVILRQKVKPVIINGAGIAGLTAALCLSRAGIPVDVHEKSKQLAPEGAGLQISPNAYKILESLGLSSSLRLAGMVPEAIEMRKARSGKVITQIPLGSSATKRYKVPYVVIHRADLHDILYQKCLETGDIKIYFGSEVIDFASHANGITTQVLHDGRYEESPGRALIIADGVHSKLISHIPKTVKPVFAGKTAWRTLVPAEQVPASFDMNKTGLWLTRNAHAVTYPVRDGTFLNVVAILKSSNSEKVTNPNPDEISASFRKWSKDFNSLFSKQVQWSGWPLYETRKLKRMAHGRLAAIGDASHVMLPFAAQGAAMAIEDAAVLAHHMSRENEIETAFKKFEEDRIPRVRKVIKTARANGKIYHAGLFKSFFRNIALRYTPHTALLGRQDWIYRWHI